MATEMEKLEVTFDDAGLVPVVVQDRLTGEVRMVAYATKEALGATLATGRATFWSRSRGELWEKGRTSGNGIEVRRVLVDCDADCVMYESEPKGPSCHTGAESCFFRVIERDGARSAPSEAHAGAPQTTMARLEATLEARKSSTGERSYTKSLYDAGAAKIGDKLREEAGELAHALAHESDARVASEAADVVYHTLVALRSRGVAWKDVLEILESRTTASGHEEKRSRASV